MIHHGDCLEVMRTLHDCSVEAVVTDPPYGLSFMGKRWDYDVPTVEVWAEALRVLKPGGHLLAFAGTRTQHMRCCRIEDAGFEVRDMLAWVYGSGFPKSLDVSKAIDKAAGEEREVVGVAGKSGSTRSCMAGDFAGGEYMETAPATDAARQWQGWGTALKPALEPITLARKPLVGTVAQNVLEHGTGALNVDGTRVPCDEVTGWGGGGSKLYEGGLSRTGGEARPQTAGRFPANFIHDGSDDVTALLGDAARFFYCAKASAKERDAGLDDCELKSGIRSNAPRLSEEEKTPKRRNPHPTVKPVALMRYLVRLVTPPGGTVLDPFAGSGSTGVACVLEGRQFVGIEQSAEYVEIARRRIDQAGKVEPQARQASLFPEDYQ